MKKLILILVILNFFTIIYLLIPVFCAIWQPNLFDKSINLLFESLIGNLIFYISASGSLILWIYCIVFWYKNDKSIITIILLIMLSGIYTPVYSCRRILNL